MTHAAVARAQIMYPIPLLDYDLFLRLAIELFVFVRAMFNKNILSHNHFFFLFVPSVLLDLDLVTVTSFIWLLSFSSETNTNSY